MVGLRRWKEDDPANIKRVMAIIGVAGLASLRTAEKQRAFSPPDPLRGTPQTVVLKRGIVLGIPVRVTPNRRGRWRSKL